MSSIFEEDSNASDDFSWRYDIANTDYGFLIFCLENDNLQNLIQTVMSDNKLKEEDLPEKKAVEFFQLFLAKCKKKRKKVFSRKWLEQQSHLVL